jgi:uncharacterized membrane protein
MLQDAIRRTGSLVLNRLLSGIWGPSLVAVALATALAFGITALDRAGLSDWLGRFGGVLAFDHPAASSHVSALLTVQIAILTLYFSITLLVLSLAAQTLGSRLIERWIARISTRATLTQWMALVTLSLLARLFLGEEAPVPRALILFDLAATVAALAWLGYGYHRLARTVHIDTSIAELGRTYALDRQDWRLREGPAPDAPGGALVHAWETGYLGGFDRGLLIEAAARTGGRLAILLPDGAFMVEGDPLARIWDDDGGIEKALRATAQISPYRTDRPTGPFSLMLLVDIGCRALSPGINDYQTAAACADWIGHGLTMRLAEEDAPEGWFEDAGGVPRLYVPESGVVAQSRPHLLALERAALAQPYVVERLLSAYGAALRRAEDPRDRRRLWEMIEGLGVRARALMTPEEAMRLDAFLARLGDDTRPLSASLAAG